ncbi:helix-turn-helix domain-containing protein [Paenibacillus aquistagni]|uniref:helix-turn-helix domain-containing protein n=1 Tax=Paenibacillus aquistagni TaxID=1852522 RepID=UPI00145B95CC|nr:helix-turn-helix transcriptional regulator [Paenibacillus aquistagni]NMM52035.1 helix-turn-helix domain-containing protein [Paenibacillus aquistagni]
MSNELGETLQSLRGRMTLREAAEMIGISHTYLSNLEKGDKTKPSIETLKKIAEAYNYPYATLLIEAGYFDEMKSDIHQEYNKNIKEMIENLLEFVKVRPKNKDVESRLKQLLKKYIVVSENDSWNDLVSKTTTINDLDDKSTLYQEMYAIHQSVFEDDLADFLCNNTIYYKGVPVKDQDRKVIRSFLDVLFEGRDSTFES